jgi:GxxExxY protein
MEVHRELGSGFLEAVYHEALEKEFQLQGIPYQSQPEIQIKYKGEPLKRTYQPDFICYEKIVVEIKALSQLTSNEEAQILNYLKASKLSPGLLINFGARSLQHKRFVYDF